MAVREYSGRLVAPESTVGPHAECALGDRFVARGWTAYDDSVVAVIEADAGANRSSSDSECSQLFVKFKIHVHAFASTGN
jgi:hypothetical protein